MYISGNYAVVVFPKMALMKSENYQGMLYLNLVGSLFHTVRQLI